MKGSVLTTKTWFLLIGAALLISAGLLNFRQRARHETPPWDGVEWVDTKDGIIAKSIERGFRGGPSVVAAGRPFDRHQPRWQRRAEQIIIARDVQIYLEQARRRRPVALPDERPSYPEVGAYWADLDNLGSIHKWTPRVLYINLIGVDLLVRWVLCALQTRWTRAVCASLRDVLSRGVCLSFLHAGR